MLKTVAIYSPKGGVGKSTLAVNLAWCAAQGARRTLLWDLDPQAAASWMLGHDGGGDRARALFSRETDLTARVRPTPWPRLALLPADASLRGLDQFFHDLGKKRRLAKLVEALGDRDRVILDCPPGLTDTTEQIVRAADLIVVPVVPSALATRAYAEIERHLGDPTRLMPVHAMVDRRRRLHADAIAAHPDWPQVPMASAIEAAAAARAPVGAIAPRSAPADAFVQIWRAVERRLAG